MDEVSVSVTSPAKAREQQPGVGMNTHDDNDMTKNPVAPGVEGEGWSRGRTDGTVLPVPEAQLQKWNIGMCVFHLAFGIIALVAGKLDLRVPMYSSSLGLDILPNNTRGWAYKPELPRRVGWLYLTVLVASFSLLSALAHFGNSVLWKRQYIQALESGYAPFRWLEYSMSASVMVLILAYISGSVFQSTLILLFALTMVTMAFGHLHEVICRPKSLEEWAEDSLLWRLQAHLIGYIPQLFAWGVVVANFMDGANASTVDASGKTRQMPTFVYGIVFGEMLIFWSFGLVQLVVSLRPPSKYYQGEIAYMWLSLFAKGFLAMLCLVYARDILENKISYLFDDSLSSGRKGKPLLSSQISFPISGALTPHPTQANVIMAGGYAEIYED